MTTVCVYIFYMLHFTFGGLGSHIGLNAKVCICKQKHIYVLHDYGVYLHFLHVTFYIWWPWITHIGVNLWFEQENRPTSSFARCSIYNMICRVQIISEERQGSHSGSGQCFQSPGGQCISTHMLLTLSKVNAFPKAFKGCPG